MTDYAIWKPEHDGHAPPNWREGMKWTLTGLERLFDRHGIPTWDAGDTFLVELEALNSPNDDASGDVDTWKQDDAVEAYNSALIEKAVKSLRQYPAELLAKHGITLAPERDWATELWAETFEVFGKHHEAARVRNGALDEKTLAAIQLLRTRFEQMKGEG